MPLHFYKPNKTNTGHACAFSQSDKDSNIYAQIIKQASWDSEKAIGSFKTNKDDPTKNVSIKLGQIEVASILDCLDRNRAFSTVHDGEKQQKSIKFEPWMNKVQEGEKPTQKGFSFSITTTDKQDSTAKISLYIGFNFAEGRCLREYLLFALHNSFASYAPVAQI